MCKFSRSILLAFVTLVAPPAFGQSGGGSSYAPGFGGTNRSSSVTTQVNRPGLNYTGTVDVSASAHNSPQGFSSSTTTSGVGTGSGTGIAVKSTNQDQSFVKGPNSISVGVSTLTATQTVNGQSYPVAVDVGFAFSRASPFGSNATTTAFGVGAPSTPRAH
jgi:hypothetical protein